MSSVHSCVGLPALRTRGEEYFKSETDHEKDEDGGQEGCVEDDSQTMSSCVTGNMEL